MKNVVKLLSMISCFGFLVIGCSPEKIEVAIKTSSLNKLVGSSRGTADVTVSYEAETSDIKKRFPEIKKAVLRYIGEDGRISIHGDTITSKFSVPIVTKSFAKLSSKKTIAQVVVEDSGMMRFEPTCLLDALNSDLRDIDGTISVDFKANRFVYRIIRDDMKECNVRATAVFVDGEAKVNYSTRIDYGDSVDVEFRCSSEQSIYHEINPFIVVGK